MVTPRALVILSKFAPHAGGTSAVWSEWCRRWPPEGLTVVAPSLPGCREVDARLPYRVVRVGWPDIPKLRMPLLWLLLGLHALKELLLRRPAVIHCQHVFENGPWGLIFQLLFGIPYWVHIYGEELVVIQRHWWLKRLVLWILARAEGVTTISHFSRELLTEFGVDRERCLLVHPGVDFAKFQTDAGNKPAGLPAGPILLTVGRLMERKGHDLIIAAMPELLKLVPNLQYVVGGTGPSLKKLKEMRQASTAQANIHFLGLIPEEELPALFRASQIFVHPNRVTARGDFEGFGIVFLEAGACGIPVIGGRSGGTPDAVLDGESGYLIDPDSISDLVERVSELLQNPETRSRMGARGREWAQEFDWDRPALAVWSASTKGKAGT